MKKGCLKVASIVLLMVFLFSITTAIGCVSADEITMVFSNKYKKIQGLRKQYAKIEALAGFFLISNVTVLKGGKSAKINHLFYNKDMIVHKGKTYAKVDSFIRFFGIKLIFAKPPIFKVKDPMVPMFDSSMIQGPNKKKYKIGSTRTTIDVLNLKSWDFISLDDIGVKANTKNKEKMGIVAVNHKIMGHWLEKDGVIYVLRFDLNKALPASRKIKKL